MRPDCALAPGVLLRPRRVRPASSLREFLKGCVFVSGVGIRHIGTKGCALKEEAKIPMLMDINRFIDSKAVFRIITIRKDRS